MGANQSKYLLYLAFVGGLFGFMYLADLLFYSGASHPPASVSVQPTEKIAQKPQPKTPKVAETKPLEKTEPQSAPQTETVAQPVPKANTETLLQDYFETLLLDNEGRKTRKEPVVRYYRHIPDGDKVDQLRKFGFYIHERPVEGSLENYESNSLYYGDSVSTEDIHLIAYFMLSQGLPLKVIQPSLYHDSWKAKSVEIGTDTLVTSQKRLTLSEIKNFRN